MKESTLPIHVAIIGCGQRGAAYGAYALDQPHLCRVVAIAEPRENTRTLFSKAHDAAVFHDCQWLNLLRASTKSLETTGNRLPVADAVVVAVQDNLHKDVVLAFARQGYHILCEKPMAINPRDILEMERAVSEAGIIFGMGHGPVLRYSPYTKALTEVLRSGQLGELVNAVHVEPVGYYHFAHSYVRGNWAKEAEPSEETAQENYEQDNTSAIQKPAAECHEVIGE